jgi:hypothetical protein
MAHRLGSSNIYMHIYMLRKIWDELINDGNNNAVTVNALRGSSQFFLVYEPFAVAFPVVFDLSAGDSSSN